MQQAAPSMLFKPTRLLGGEVASGKKREGKSARMHVGGVVQGKCQIRGPVLQTNKGEPSALTGSWQATTTTRLKW